MSDLDRGNSISQVPNQAPNSLIASIKYIVDVCKKSMINNFKDLFVDDNDFHTYNKKQEPQIAQIAKEKLPPNVEFYLQEYMSKPSIRIE